MVDANHKYADLDELIVNHVQAMARKVEELMAHEKFKHGTEDDLRKPSTTFLYHLKLNRFSIRFVLEERPCC